jgi:hypothetical protein
LIPVASADVDLKSSGLAVTHPVHCSRLAAAVGPYRDGTFSAGKCRAGPANRESEYDFGALHRPLVLVDHLDYEWGHHPPLEVIRLILAREHSYLEALLGGQLRERLSRRWIGLGRSAALR